MPDDILSNSNNLVPSAPQKNSSIEEDFPTLKSDTPTHSATSSSIPGIGEEKPVWFVSPKDEPPPPQNPVHPTSVSETPPTVATKSSNPSTQTQTPISSEPPTLEPFHNPFSPLGGTNDTSIASSASPTTTSTLPHVQFGNRPVSDGGFDSLDKVISTTQNKKDQDLVLTNIYPDATPQIKKPRNALVPIITTISLVTLLALSAVGAYAITYDYIKINNSKISVPISEFVQNLPFTPKTAKFLLTHTAKAQEKITKENFDFSISSRSKEYNNVFNSNTIEAAAKGSIDYSDLKNVRFSINTSLTKFFNADIRSIDNKAYFKINSFPLTIAAFFGLDETNVKELTKDWIVYDMTPLNTEASKILDQEVTDETNNNDFIKKVEKVLFNEEVLSKISVSEEKINNTNYHKLHFAPDLETIDNLEKAINDEFRDKAVISSKKASESIQDLEINMWIEKKTYNLKKLTTSLKANNESVISGSQKSTTDFAMSYTLSNIGEEVKVEVPQSSITTDIFILNVQNMISKKSAERQQSTSSSTSPQNIMAPNLMNLLPQ